MKEAQISREIQRFMKQVGFGVWSVEQGFRKERGGTRQTPGIPDLWIMGHGLGVWVEVKTPKGKLRESQLLFQSEAQANEVMHEVWRDVRDAFDFCVRHEILEEA